MYAGRVPVERAAGVPCFTVCYATGLKATHVLRLMGGLGLREGWLGLGVVVVVRGRLWVNDSVRVKG